MATVTVHGEANIRFDSDGEKGFVQIYPRSEELDKLVGETVDSLQVHHAQGKVLTLRNVTVIKSEPWVGERDSLVFTKYLVVTDLRRPTDKKE